VFLGQVKGAMHSRTGKYFMLTVLSLLPTPSLSTHPPRTFIFDESLSLPPTASFHSRVTRLGQPRPTFSFRLVFRRKRYREEIKSFFSIKKTVLLVVRSRNCETFAPAELIKNPSIGALFINEVWFRCDRCYRLNYTYG